MELPAAASLSREKIPEVPPMTVIGLPKLHKHPVPTLTAQNKAEIMALISKRTQEFIVKPATIMRFTDHELTGPYTRIADGNPVLQREIQTLVKTMSDWQYIQSGASYTVLEWHVLYTRMCRALGVS